MTATPEQVSNFRIDLGRLYLMKVVINQDMSYELKTIIEEKLDQAEDILSVRFYTAMFSDNRELAQKALIAFEQQVRQTEQIVLAEPKTSDDQPLYNENAEQHELGQTSIFNCLDDLDHVAEQNEQKTGDIVDDHFTEDTEDQEPVTSLADIHSDVAAEDTDPVQEVDDSEQQQEDHEIIQLVENEGDERVSHYVIRKDTPITNGEGIKTITGFMFSNVDVKAAHCFIFVVGGEGIELQENERNTFKLALTAPDTMVMPSPQGAEQLPIDAFLAAKQAMAKGYNFCVDIEIVATKESSMLLMNSEAMIGRTDNTAENPEILFSSNDLFMLGHAINGMKFVGFLTTEKP